MSDAKPIKYSDKSSFAHSERSFEEVVEIIKREEVGKKSPKKGNGDVKKKKAKSTVTMEEKVESLREAQSEEGKPRKKDKKEKKEKRDEKEKENKR